MVEKAWKRQQMAKHQKKTKTKKTWVRTSQGRRRRTSSPTGQEEPTPCKEHWQQKTTKKRGLDHDRARKKLTLARPEERKRQRRELLCHPGGHVDQRGHIPHPREGKSINDQGLATEGERTRMSRFENMVHCIDTGMPIVIIPIPNSNKNTQNLYFGRRPIKNDRRVRVATPAPQRCKRLKKGKMLPLTLMLDYTDDKRGAPKRQRTGQNPSPQEWTTALRKIETARIKAEIKYRNKIRAHNRPKLKIEVHGKAIKTRGLRSGHPTERRQNLIHREMTLIKRGLITRERGWQVLQEISLDVRVNQGSREKIRIKRRQRSTKVMRGGDNRVIPIPIPQCRDPPIQTKLPFETKSTMKMIHPPLPTWHESRLGAP